MSNRRYNSQTRAKKMGGGMMGGSGTRVSFPSQTLNPGDTIDIRIRVFLKKPQGGGHVKMDNSNFTFTFSNGSVSLVPAHRGSHVEAEITVPAD